MKKALVLIIGVGIYVWFLQLGQAVAERELNHVQNLYTDSQAHAEALVSSNR